MIKAWAKWLLCAALVLAVAASFQPSTGSAAGITYYVSAENGSDSNNGTSLNTAFKTIQKAADMATAGDTVLIGGGVYRETVTPAHSGTSANPIVYQNYNEETVTISGADPVTGWTLDSGHIYKAPMSWDLGAGNQVFADGIMMREAQWPNQAGTLLNPTQATMDSGSNATHIEDSALPGANDYWNGATVWTISGKEWISMTSTVTDYDASTHTLAFNPLKSTGNANYDPKSGNTYVLSGIKAALDTEREWWYDSANSMIYLWAPGGGDPTGQTIEAKKRSVAIDLSGLSYVTIDGIHTFAATIITDIDTAYCNLQGLVSEFVSHNKLNTIAAEQSNFGILINGSHNVLRDSEIVYSSGSLVTVNGSDNSVINNKIHYGNYVPDYSGLVNIGGTNSLVSHNSIYDSGRSTIVIGGIDFKGHSDIQYNDVYNAGLLTKDLGIIYTANKDGQFVEIHHNLVHDNKSSHINPGIYLDSYTSNFIIHHNVVWNNAGLQFNNPSNYNLIYNNTVWTNTGKIESAAYNFGDDMYGDRIFNNIVKGYDTEVTAYANKAYNILKSPGFVDEANHDYHLLSTSTAVDAGTNEPGITDGYVGNAPDIGAYEYGGSGWTAGHNFTSPPNPVYTQADALHMNRVSNGGFETGDLTGWTRTDDQTAVVVASNHWALQENQGMSRTQYYGLELSGGVDGVQQVITGLEPNTKYIIGGWIRTEPGTGELGVKDYGGPLLSASSSSSTWTFKTIEFVTGTTNTSATFYFKKTSVSGVVYVDDAGLIIQSTDSHESFENGLGSDWTALNGYASFSTGQSHTGSKSYLVNEDVDNIRQSFAISQNKIVSMWFYDNASNTNMFVFGMVDNGTDIRGIGVRTPESTTHYVVRTGSSFTATSVARTTGWHQFKWDYSSGTKVDLYVDGTLVASPTGLTSFNKITLGDWWADSRISNAYFDDVDVYDVPPIFSDGFENGLGDWTALSGTSSLSTVEAHSGFNSYIMDEETDHIEHAFGASFNRVASMWFYDDASNTNMYVFGRVDDGTDIRGIGVRTPESTTHYVVRTGSSFTVTSVARTNGWHQFQWDYTSGTKVDLYIDGTLVSSPTGITDFNRITVGDWWADNRTSNAYFDDIIVQ